MMILWAVALLACLIPEVTSECPTLANTNGTRTVKIGWTLNVWTTTGGECEAWVMEPNITKTKFSMGETKSLPGVNNDCLQFTCDDYDVPERRFHYNKDASSCAYAGADSQCSSEVKTGGSGGSCQEDYTCYSAVYDRIPKYKYTEWYKYRHGWFAMFSGYTCGDTGSGPCAADQCYNQFADPRKDDTNNRACLDVNDTVTTKDFHVYVCQQKSTCDSESYTDLTLSYVGCNHDGQVVPAGTVTWSDACYHTVCVIDTDTNLGSLVTSFKDHEGCVWEDKCVAVGAKVAGKVRHTCADLVCHKDETVEKPFYFEVIQTGCLYGDVCYMKRDKIRPNVTDTCDELECNFDKTDKSYYWDHVYSGCYKPPGDSCTHANNKAYTGKCFKNKCFVKDYGRWKTIYKKSKKCSPSTANCSIDGVPGCSHDGKCHPVKTVIKMDSCTQFVCHSSNKKLNSGTYVEGVNLPTWKARATGCYGPTGCMKLGEQYVDPRTNNTYRCDYSLAGWGIKMAKFHKACVAPNGQSMPMGKSVYVDPVWYSCYRRGKMGAFNTSEIYIPATDEDNKTCGKHNGEWVLRGEPFFTSVGICKRERRACIVNCTYFDTPCERTDFIPWRWIGDTYKDPDMGNAECVCTQDSNINNKNFTTSRFHTPALCSQEKVFNGACKDPNDGSKYQWGEMWIRNGSDPLEICTCHPLTRQAYCSTYLPDVNKVFDQMNIKKA